MAVTKRLELALGRLLFLVHTQYRYGQFHSPRTRPRARRARALAASQRYAPVPPASYLQPYAELIRLDDDW